MTQPQFVRLDQSTRERLVETTTYCLWKFDEIEDSFRISNNEALAIRRPIETVDAMVTDLLLGDRHLDIDVQVPQRDLSSRIAGRKHGWVLGRPLDVEHVIGEAFEHKQLAMSRSLLGVPQADRVVDRRAEQQVRKVDRSLGRVNVGSRDPSYGTKATTLNEIEGLQQGHSARDRPLQEEGDACIPVWPSKRSDTPWLLWMRLA